MPGTAQKVPAVARDQKLCTHEKGTENQNRLKTDSPPPMQKKERKRTVQNKRTPVVEPKRETRAKGTRRTAESKRRPVVEPHRWGRRDAVAPLSVFSGGNRWPADSPLPAAVFCPLLALHSADFKWEGTKEEGGPAKSFACEGLIFPPFFFFFEAALATSKRTLGAVEETVYFA
ncbi:hypothetical protein HPB48_020038 [Haemaphysalis longicornis]|uniref:Uncharacterized protein n=1 Tax=Haemaphysalis longicornis TaxID=44386 RepID=A0A9J6GVZ6_HAELO|nr:hypothetical protein HPB48_020038 [Haemaphysalis longicornis]